MCLNLNHFANAGATHSQQLGISLALAYETHYRLQTDSLHDFWVNFAIGSDYFGEIAKLRAFRRLWDHLCQELGLKPSQPTLYCETALRNKTIKDAYNNMMRTTSEAMAAVIGGADEVSIKGFNHTFAEPTPFGERIARNQSSILQHESHLDAVKDLAQGSYFIEELTEKLAEKAWQFFVKIEAEGGFVEAMRKGWLQDWVEGAAEKEQKAFDQGEKVLIGANQYAKEDEDLKAIIKKGHFFSESKKETAVKKLIAKRLSEGVEK
ncbi:MAG: methylmalonyl-CoA mutase family protein [Owenweeksia sp.]|nr:methylmalonyl-CoA mutase family protein [Owenweeksia sp.]